ncbi:MAG: hypothetical protein JWR05_2890, partial [Mucilaginibacter sp.]|nr:hypothetical protein [Mucilaginibacter sp.]
HTEEFNNKHTKPTIYKQHEKIIIHTGNITFGSMLK